MHHKEMSNLKPHNFHAPFSQRNRLIVDLDKISDRAQALYHELGEEHLLPWLMECSVSVLGEI